mgnify:CR=1 FL=1
MAHMQKRVLPYFRVRAIEKIGENGFKGIIALMIAIGLVLMIIGFRLIDPVVFYDFGSVGLLLNNIIMMLAVAFIALGHSKSRFRKYFRHPMLLGIICWSVSHLLANGDSRSLILFLSFGVWSLTEIILINRSAIHFEPFTNGSLKGDVRFVAIATLAYFGVSIAHLYLGVNPFF